MWWFACSEPVVLPDTTGGDPTFEDLLPPPEGEGFQMAMSAQVEPGEEAWTCAVYTSPNGEVANVNRVEFQQTQGMHHLTLSTSLSPDGVGAPEGTYRCEDVYTGAFMEDQVMMFGDSGNDSGVLQLPPGVVAMVPAAIPVVHEVHFLNATDAPIELRSVVNVYTIPSEEVVDGVWGGSVRDENIHVPAGAVDHVEWSRCVFNRDVEVHFLAAHQHALGERFTIAPFDGVAVGDILFENTDWRDPMVTQYDPPLVVPAGQGFEWACHWSNPAEDEVTYGLTAADEMCNLAVVHTPMDLTAACEVVETSDGVLWP